MGQSAVKESKMDPKFAKILNITNTTDVKSLFRKP
jgi:hypothetical protein